MRRTAEHQMLEQMGKAGMLGMLVARTDIVNDVQRHHLRAGILVVYQPQAVGETMLIYLHTCVTGRDSLPKGLTQFCFISQSQSPSQSSHPLPDGRCGLSLPVVSYLPHPCLQRLRRTRYIRRPDAVCRLQWYMPLPVPA